MNVVKSTNECGISTPASSVTCLEKANIKLRASSSQVEVALVISKALLPGQTGSRAIIQG